MPVVWAPLVLVSPLLTLALNVMSWAETTQRYRRKCRLLHDRVKGIHEHLSELQISQCTPDPPAMQDTLKSLEEVLYRAQGIVQSCQRKKKAWDFMKARKNTAEFAFLNEQITNLMERFHVANRILMTGLYSDQTFMVVLRMLLQSDAGKRVLQLQDNRALVEECIMQNIGSNNMSPEKIEVMRLIKEILGLRQRNPAEAVYYDEDIRYVENIATDIVLNANAANHNREEAQRVAQIVRNVLYFLPNLQFPQMARHPDTRGYVSRLQHELHAVHEAITCRPPLLCGGPAASMVSSATSSFWREQAKRVRGIANNIELTLQSLTFIALDHVIRNKNNA